MKRPLMFCLLLIFTCAGTARAQHTPDSAATPRIFGGGPQYNTWTLGLDLGATSNHAIVGGVNNYEGVKLGLGGMLTLRKQVAHSFGIEGDFGIGQVNGSSTYSVQGTDATFPVYSFSTMYYSAGLLGVINVATVDFLRRKNAINFFVEAGLGMQWYNAKLYNADQSKFNYFKYSGSDHTTSGGQVFESYVPTGVGIKWRLSDSWGFNLGYNMYFTDGDGFDGAKLVGDYVHRDKYTLGYAGIEYTFGSKSKPNLEWVNPVAMMYDELNDPTLKQEVEALKGRVSNAEKAVDDLKRDSDGDGVADQFDKCPGTPAGTVVDGSGCTIVFPQADIQALVGADMPALNNNQQLQNQVDKELQLIRQYYKRKHNMAGFAKYLQVEKQNVGADLKDLQRAREQVLTNLHIAIPN